MNSSSNSDDPILREELAQALDAREQVARRERGVLLEQPVAGQRAILHRQQRLVVAEAAGRQRVGAEHAGQRVAAQRVDHRDGLAAREQLLVDAVRDAVVAGHVQHELVELELVGEQRRAHARSAGAGRRWARPGPASAAGGTSVTCDWKRACAMRSGHSRTAWPVVKRHAVRSPGCRRELMTLPRGTSGPAASAGSSRSGSSCAISIDGVGAR